MDAIIFLKKEHKKIKSVFNSISKKTNNIKLQKIQFKALARYLVIHETMEHQTWYPHFQKDQVVKKIVKSLISQEKKAAAELKKIKIIKNDDAWENHFLNLKKAVIQHAKNEETKLFPKIRKFVPKSDLVKIGNAMKKYKNAKLKLKVNAVARSLKY